MQPTVFVFVALACEAKPLVQAWNLKKLTQQKPFTIYSNQERVVVIAGAGKLAMAAAVAYTMCLYSETVNPILINLGIAGHQIFPVGHLYLADKIIDCETAKNHYPQLTFANNIQTSAVITLTKPSSDYVADSLFDMEASAFYEIATKFNTNEFLHSLKIVSDNTDSAIEHISEARVVDWLGNKVDDINHLLNNLLKARDLLPKTNNDLYFELIQRLHFTEAGAVKLKGLMQRWRVVMGDSVLTWNDSGARSGKELIAWMELQLEGNSFRL